ncbi:MarR family transcriptional regulator [Paenibacillus psychroresistens]|uniref:MarR family transcriptional regulator n=1 Tax=Paenibacillus psychroresistens TaxID=1778678 RepID=A0A6B8RVU1_9BACL|nr:MarR family transcriptional regulator [Paenibacillus psychroresistens]QGQ99563.1 MarR family transcriptional regulator [Paenibacillus psychroresistens]
MSATDETIKLDTMLCFSIYACSRELTRLYRPILSKFKLTYPQFLVMVVLWENGSCIVSDLGEKLLLDSATLTPLLKRLEEANLVHRKRSSVDERKVEISLTEKGESLKSKLSDLPITIFTDICKTEENYIHLLSQSKQLLSDIHEIARREPI